MNKIDLAEALIAIADSGSIHEAATRLHQTNAAISKKLTKLENHLRVQLVHRTRKGLILTEAGQRYYHEAKKALTQFALAEQSIIQSAIQLRGELKIVANQYYAQTLLLPKLSSFLAQYSELKVNLDIAEVLPDFNAKKMDILLGVSALGEGQIVRKKIAVTRYVLCASPIYLKQRGIPKTPSELLQHDTIAHSARKPNEMIILDHEKQLILTPKLLVNNTQLMIQAALAHLGIIWTHENMLEDLITKKKLVCVLNEYTKKSINIYAYYKYQPYRDPKIQAFMDFFVKRKDF